MTYKDILCHSPSWRYTRACCKAIAEVGFFITAVLAINSVYSFLSITYSHMMRYYSCIVAMYADPKLLIQRYSTPDKNSELAYD